MNPTYYKTLIFDCDGVVLNSNRVKTLAFYQTALPYGEAAARALMDYHVTNGGISRYKKFDYFLRQILGRSDAGQEGAGQSELKNLLDAFADESWKGLINCEAAEGIAALREKTADSRWLLVSGGDQDELRRLFALRGLTPLFDGGIYGSPDSKESILKREIENGNIEKPAVFVGDTQYDYQAANGAGLDFIFVSGWSEFADWQIFFADKDVSVITGISQLNRLFS